ncbi:TAXI family TRAP transporter solute-binding subunit [Rhodoferax sp. GW822-FHT02A01]|uniref:TAXI family TRAP transporter solute-binding subunit n=1 Tax=Rhodoferax sp. GW822-FHT02A01 TaxID=3141537 RepID=UPI00315D450E
MGKTIAWFRRFSWRDALASALPVAAAVAVAVWAALHFIDPAPSRHVVIATGAEDSEYLDFANRYAKELAQDGVELEVQSSGGALDNVKRLRDEDDAARIAFLQDGLSDTEESRASDSDVDLVSLGSVSYEPIWIFYRDRHLQTRLSALKGQRIAVGPPGSGTHVFALRLLQANGVDAKNSRFVTVGRAAAQKLLQQGEVDAGIFIGAPESAMVRELVATPGIRIMNLDQAEAYTRQFPYLHHLVLPHGAWDLGSNRPAHDLNLLATTTTVVVTQSLHPALVSLLLKAMQKTHGGADLLNAPKAFPAVKDTDFPLSKDAARFYQSGPPFLQRYLPFWLATLVDRAALAIIPLLAILVPVLRTAPALYGWRIRRRIYRWYGELKYLEIQVRSPDASESREELLRQLDQIEHKVTHAVLPLAFSEHAYMLKEHIDLVRRQMQAATAGA